MIDLLSVEDRSAGRLKQTLIDAPDGKAIESAIARLDGSVCTMLVIRSSEGNTLTIGGGNDGLCVVDFAAPNDQFLTLRCLETKEREREIVTGGQLAPFEESFLIPIEIAMAIGSEWHGGDPPEFKGYRWVRSAEVR